MTKKNVVMKASKSNYNNDCVFLALESLYYKINKKKNTKIILFALFDDVLVSLWYTKCCPVYTLKSIIQEDHLFSRSQPLTHNI